MVDGERINKELTINALRQAMSRRGIKAGLILHSDRAANMPAMIMFIWSKKVVLFRA